MTSKFNVDEDIKKARTLPASFYRDPEVFEAIRQKIFYKSWQWIGDIRVVSKESNTFPFVLLEGFLTEPMVLTRESDGTLHCLSNVCTHRGNTVVQDAAKKKKLSCGYHGRRFALDGKFEFMPEFQDVFDFPADCDNLYRFPLKEWGPFLFSGLNPQYEIEQVITQMNDRVGFLPLNEFYLDRCRCKDYYIDSHWALYCDNYLEGFHIPFVHEDLNTVLEYSDYETVLYEHMNLQIGFASSKEEVFAFPDSHIDFGKKVAAYYYWVFPNMMFNFYPWGLSVNIVQPMELNKTKVSFYSYVYDQSKLEQGAGAVLDKVELEDEAVVEGVQKGVRSKFYKAGRFSPTREKGVHHFHRLLAEFLNLE